MRSLEWSVELLGGDAQTADRRQPLKSKPLPFPLRPSLGGRGEIGVHGVEGGLGLRLGHTIAG
jgi:hypothetical protein